MNNEQDGFKINQNFEEKKINPVPDDTGFIGLSNFSDKNSAKKNTKRKKHNFLERFKAWWKTLTKPKKGLVITCVSLFLVLLTLIGILWPYLNYNYKEITSKPKDLGFDKVIDEKIVNIALFGIDTRNRKSFKGLSDSMMILSLNTETKKVKVVSLMRDTLVPIEKEGKTTYGKFNTAYGTGGPELGIKTINKVFGLDIKEYATVNFYGMVDIIDAVGGIDITVVDDELKFKGLDHPNLNGCMDEICLNLGKNANDYHINTTGKMHVNGIQAVAYSRIRNCRNVWGTNNDYGRTDRQRYVMQELFTKATTLGKSEYMKLAKALIPCSETSLSYSEIISLAFNILLEHPTFEQYRIPQENFLMNYPSGFGSVVYFDLDYASRAIHSIIYDDATLEEFIAANPIEKNDWYAKRNGPSKSGNTVTSKPAVTSTPSETAVSSNTSSENTVVGPETPVTPTIPEEKPEQKTESEDGDDDASKEEKTEE